MFEKKFETWLANSISNIILFTLGMHVINPGYFKIKLSYFTKLSDDGTKKSNRTLVELNNAASISDNDNKHPPDLFNLKAK